MDTWDHEYDLGFLDLLVIQVISDFLLTQVLYLVFVNREQAEQIDKVKDLGFEACFKIVDDCDSLICWFVLHCNVCIYE